METGNLARQSLYAYALPMTSRLAQTTLCNAVLLGVLGGCQQPRDANSPTTPSAEVAASTMPAVERAERAQRVLRRQVGDAVRVGHVEAIDADGVTHIVCSDTAGLRRGGSLLYLDRQRRPIAYGTILEATPSRIRARPAPGMVEEGRSPQPGDLAAFNLSEAHAAGPSGQPGS